MAEMPIERGQSLWQPSDREYSSVLAKQDEIEYRAVVGIMR
jgi:hypothetical protein